MPGDIRDKAYLTHDDVIGLNFIKSSGPFVFRRHFRQGLRSHVMELLHASDVELEKNGTVIEGTRWFPRAKPFKILRLFRTKLNTLETALKETARVKLVEKYLAPDYMAQSDEFIVDYAGPEGPGLLLCGLQAYVEGEVIDPWSVLDGEAFRSELYGRMRRYLGNNSPTERHWITTLQEETAILVKKIKTMLLETGHVPDLAGVGNLLAMRSGRIILVDINNISPVCFNSTIALDDRDYPVCDKSIEALAHLEQKILDRTIDAGEGIYKGFLTPERMEAVKIQEKRFYQKLNGK